MKLIRKPVEGLVVASERTNRANPHPAGTGRGWSAQAAKGVVPGGRNDRLRCSWGPSTSSAV